MAVEPLARNGLSDNLNPIAGARVLRIPLKQEARMALGAQSGGEAARRFMNPLSQASPFALQRALLGASYRVFSLRRRLHSMNFAMPAAPAKAAMIALPKVALTP